VKAKAQVPDFEHGLVVQFVERGLRRPAEILLDEVGGQLAPAAVAQHDPLCSEMAVGKEPNGQGVANDLRPRDPGILEVFISGAWIIPFQRITGCIGSDRGDLGDDHKYSRRRMLLRLRPMVRRAGVAVCKVFQRPGNHAGFLSRAESGR